MQALHIIDFLIIEGIFAKKILENFYDQKYFFIELNTDKFICMKRVINRDINERYIVVINNVSIAVYTIDGVAKTVWL